jgi:hypothetical protein
MLKATALLDRALLNWLGHLVEFGSDRAFNLKTVTCTSQIVLLTDAILSWH